MDTSPLRFHIDSHGVAWLTLARPQRHNAFDEALIGALHEAVSRCADDPAVRVLVLTGDGPTFCAGADVAWMQRAAAASEADNRADAGRFAAMLHALAICPKPTLARVQGLALGGGVGLVCACDLAIAASDARFAVSEVRLGILPAVIGPYLIRALGPRQAQRLALTGERFGADEALRLGLVQQVAAPADLDGAVRSALADLLAGGPQAQSEVKALFNQLRPADFSVAVRDRTATAIARVRASSEAREGFAAFLDKRSPAWKQ